MDNRLRGRIAVITGASSGIGKATALKFVNSSARVVLADLKSSGLEQEIQAKHGADSAIFIQCDVLKEDQIQTLIEKAVEFGGRVDCMLNFAGVAAETKYDGTARVDNFSTEDFDLVMGVNCRGVWLCCKYAIQQMLKQEPWEANARGERTRGWVVNAASILGTTASANAPAYTPSKFAVVGMTKQIAIDYAKDRIHVNALCPGFVDTPLIGRYTANEQYRAGLEARHPWNTLGRPEDIADAALFLCSDESAWMTGHPLVIDGGYTAQ